MHELSIALAILDIAAARASQEPGRATAVHVRIGELSGVEAEALLASWDLARRASLLENAELAIECVPVLGECPACQAKRRPLSIQHLRCPTCEGELTRIVAGRELEVTALEMALEIET